MFPYDQGAPVLPGPCTYSGVYNSYSCVANSTLFSTPPLNPLFKPTPLPAKGIFGDPQLFVLESRDADTESRNFGPVLFNVSGSIDLVSAAMDHVRSGARGSAVGPACRHTMLYTALYCRLRLTTHVIRRTTAFAALLLAGAFAPLERQA